MGGTGKNVLGDFTSKDPVLTFKPEDVDMLIGSRFKQRYAKKISDDYFIHPAEWNIAKKKWQPYVPKKDWWVPQYPADWDKKPASRLCEGCHQTGYDLEAKKGVEPNIACEACHGPGKEHVEAMNKLEEDKKAGKLPKVSQYVRDNKIINPGLLDVDMANDVCFQCHLSGKSIDNKTAWAIGFKPGDVLSKYWVEDAFEHGKGTYTFWSNGSANKNRVQGNTYKFSEMYKQGVKCITCHNPHGTDYKSLVYKPGNNLCLTCHGPDSPAGLTYSYQEIEEHTRHKRTSTGSDCMECHMVKTGKHANDAESRDHTFKFISPAMTKEHGVPNACNNCHTDKSVDWAIEAVKTWGMKQ
ncbi:MAG: cytochrome C [Deltaproteobacteria bacterium]|nr:cytochrome C [Deltaproteobacteria bacterium]